MDACNIIIIIILQTPLSLAYNRRRRAPVAGAARERHRRGRAKRSRRGFLSPAGSHQCQTGVAARAADRRTYGFHCMRGHAHTHTIVQFARIRFLLFLTHTRGRSHNILYYYKRSWPINFSRTYLYYIIISVRVAHSPHGTIRTHDPPVLPSLCPRTR